MAGDSLLRSLFYDTTPYFCYVLFISTLGPFQFGFHLAELNAPQGVITCERKSINEAAVKLGLPQCMSMNTEQFAVVSSIYTLGGLLGALAAGPCLTRYGRLLAMRLSSLFCIIGPVFECLAGSIGVLAFGRVISGIGAGAAITAVPIYIGDVAPPKEKGLFGAMTQVMINLGIVIAQLLGYFLSRDNMWRIILAVAGGVAALQFLGLFLVPESPKWLAERGQRRGAHDILKRMRGSKADIEEEFKAWGMKNAESDVEEESLLRPSRSSPPPKNQSTTVSFFQALIHPTYRPALIAVVAVMMTQQFTGINSIVMYSVSLLSSLLPTTAAILTVAVGVVNLLLTILCAPLSDKIGRKTCLLLSIAGMGTCSILLAVGIIYSVKILSAIATLLFVASFAVGLGPVPFILSTELVGPEAVGTVQSWALAANWIATFLVSQFFPILNEVLGKGRVYFVFAGFAVVLGGFIAWWVPETKGKSGMDEVWGRRGERLE